MPWYGAYIYDQEPLYISIKELVVAGAGSCMCHPLRCNFGSGADPNPIYAEGISGATSGLQAVTV